MRRCLLVLSVLGAALHPALAADVAPPVAATPVVVGPPAMAVAPAPPTACWRYGAHGYGWYPCEAGPPAYWRSYDYGWRPYWGRHHRGYWSD
jgi:hypothetical protein